MTYNTESSPVGAALNSQNDAVKGGAMARHIAAIRSRNVTKRNVIGLRKAINHVDRLASGWSGNRSNATFAEVDSAMAALAECKPMVRGDLHASGVRILTDKRYAKRLAPVADKIAKLMSFHLVGFECIKTGYHVPIYEADTQAGNFRFYVIPWQSANAYGLESGPTLLGADS